MSKKKVTEKPADAVQDFPEPETVIAPVEAEEENPKQERPRERENPRPKKTGEKTLNESIIYIGPTLPGGKLSRYTTFRKQLPARIVKLIEECKALDTLLVPVSKLGLSEQKLNNSASLFSVRFAEVRKHFYKGDR